MCTSNSGDPFNQPSKSCTKWLLVMYKPGAGGGGGTTSPVVPPQSMHSMTLAGGREKSVSTGTTASTGVAGGAFGSRICRRPSGSNAIGGSSSVNAVATRTFSSTARSVQAAISIRAARPQLRCNMSPPGKSGGSLWGNAAQDRRPFLARRTGKTRDSRAMLPLAVDSTYWQQRVAYEILAAVDEPSGVLSGNVRIKYVNQSPDTLRDF